MKQKDEPKRAVIVGATSGMGHDLALRLLAEGWTIGITGRRADELLSIQDFQRKNIHICAMDVTQEDATTKLHELIHEMGGMDLYVHSAGIGRQNFDLAPETELDTVNTNAMGFTRMTTAAFRYFLKQGKGHIAIISSIAGTKGLGIAPAYSATKRFQNTYIDALEQLANMHHVPIVFTDLRPGFVDTPFLKGQKHYPMMLNPEYAGRLNLNAIKHRRRIAIIDWKYKILVFFWRLIPGWIWKRMDIRN